MKSIKSSKTFKTVTTKIDSFDFERVEDVTCVHHEIKIMSSVSEEPVLSEKSEMMLIGDYYLTDDGDYAVDLLSSNLSDGYYRGVFFMHAQDMYGHILGVTSRCEEIPKDVSEFKRFMRNPSLIPVFSVFNHTDSVGYSADQEFFLDCNHRFKPPKIRYRKFYFHRYKPDSYIKVLRKLKESDDIDIVDSRVISYDEAHKTETYMLVVASFEREESIEKDSKLKNPLASWLRRHGIAYSKKIVESHDISSSYYADYIKNQSRFKKGYPKRIETLIERFK